MTKFLPHNCVVHVHAFRKSIVLQVRSVSMSLISRITDDTKKEERIKQISTFYKIGCETKLSTQKHTHMLHTPLLKSFFNIKQIYIIRIQSFICVAPFLLH